MRAVGVPSRSSAAALVIAALLLLAQALAAAPPRKVVVMLPASVDAARQEAALGAIRAQLGDLALELVVERPAEVPADLRDRLDLASQAAKTHGAMGVFVLEIERAGDLLVYLVEPEARRALVRRVQAPSSDAAGFEELSLIVRSTSSALLEGREIGMEQGPELAPKPPPPEPEAPPPPPPAKPPEKPPERSPSTGRLGAFYVGEGYAPEASWQSGLGLRLSGSPDGRLFVGLGYVVFPPVDVDTEAAAARVTRYPGEVFAGYELPLDQVRVGAELGLRVELATRRTLRAGLGLEPTPDDERWLWGAAARAVVRWALSDRVALGAGLGADISFNDSEYVVDASGGQDPVLRPRTVRPHAEVGVVVDLW
jgi:hypothetical protein